MSEVIYVLRSVEEELILEATELKPCPVCGAKAYLSKDAPDGFFMGYSAGCPRFCIGDGIHGIETDEDAQTRGYSVHGCLTAAEAIAAWNRRANRDE